MYSFFNCMKKGLMNINIYSRYKNNTLSGARTRDHLVKSQALCRLSYESEGIPYSL